MTVSRRKTKPVAKAEDNRSAESGVQYHCDVCGLDISSTVRISCATCANAPGALDTYDLCCSCFLEGAESGTHKAHHDYRVVEQHSYPIFCDDWGADEELLLIDGAQMYGLGNWADIADHIGNRSKEEVQEHYIQVYIEGRDGTREGDLRAEHIVDEFLASHPQQQATRRRMLPVVGPNLSFKASIDAEEFQKRKRQRIEDARSTQAAFSGAGAASSSQSQGANGKPAPPKPLVSAPTSHSELATFMPGRLEFEHEYENDAENYVKDMEFGKVYRYGGEMIPSEMEALGRKADQGRVRMEGSGRGGPGLGQRGGNKGIKEEDGGQGTDPSKEKDGENDANENEGDDDDDANDAQDEDEEGDGEEGEDEDEDEEDKEDKDEDEDTTTVLNKAQNDAAGASAADTTQNENETEDSAAASADAAAASASASQPADTDDRAPDWDEEEADLELKLMVLDIYNERLSRRGRRKEFIFERNLIDYKRTVAMERKRPKEEREMLNRVRHFAQMQTTLDFEHFYNGLCYEDALRRAAAQLQMYRRAGITTLTDAARFDTEQAERARRAAVAAEGGLAAFAGSGSIPRSAAARASMRETSTMDDSDSHATSSKKKSSAAAAATTTATTSSTATPTNGTSSAGQDADKKAARKPPKPLDLSSHPSLSLLTRAEQELCSVVRIQPQVFMIMKKDIIVEYVRRKGKFSRRESRQLFKCDVNKVGRVYDLLESEGYLREAARLGGDWNGTGVPPGFTEAPPSKDLKAKDSHLSERKGTDEKPTGANESTEAKLDAAARTNGLIDKAAGTPLANGHPSPSSQKNGHTWSNGHQPEVVHQQSAAK